MTEGIVDRLEVVDVDHDRGETLLFRAIADLVLELGFQFFAIVHAGEIIGVHAVVLDVQTDEQQGEDHRVQQDRDAIDDDLEHDAEEEEEREEDQGEPMILVDGLHVLHYIDKRDAQKQIGRASCRERV